MNELGIMIGRGTPSEVVLLNQQEKPAPYSLQDILVLEDEIGSIFAIEITQTMTFGEFEPQTIDGIVVGESTLHIDNIKKDKPVYVAKARVLNDLSTPISPNSVVRKPTFEEIQKHIVFGEKEKSFHLGIIKGTEDLQKELPNELKNISPLWDKKKEEVTEQQGVPFMYDYTSLREYPHIGLFGSSGSGKSFGMHSVLEEFMKKSIPGIFLDPHNEVVFKKTMKGLPEEHQEQFLSKYETFKIGLSVGIPFSKLNVNDLYYLLEFVGGISDPQRAALDAIYEQGDTFSHLQTKLDYLKTAFEYFDSPKWSREPKEESIFREENEDAALFYDKVKKMVANVSVVDALTWRLDALEKTNVFDEKNGIDKVANAIQVGKIAVIQGSISKLQMVSSYLIRTLYNLRREYIESKESFANQKPFFPPFIIGGDEFHNFAPAGYTNPTGRIIREIAKEARKYGVYLLVSTQRTTAIDEDVFAQLNTKFIYRLNTSNDIDLTSREANLTPEQTEQLPKLIEGESFVVNPKLPRTILIKFRTTLTEPSNMEDPFEELSEHLSNSHSDIIALLNVYIGRRPIRPTDIPKTISMFLKEELGRSVTFDETIEALDEMVRMGSAKKNKSPIGVEYVAN